MVKRDEGGGGEMCYRDADGKKHDAELWDEILGEDTEGTWDISKEPDAADSSQPPQPNPQG